MISLTRYRYSLAANNRAEISRSSSVCGGDSGLRKRDFRQHRDHGFEEFLLKIFSFYPTLPGGYLWQQQKEVERER